jgi:proton-translocating NADH-quinone oxidoreductase chain N
MDPVTAVLWLVGLPLLVSPFIYLVGRLSVRRNKGAGLGRWLAILTILFTFAPLLVIGLAYYSYGGYQIQFNGIMMTVDGLSILVAVTVLVTGLMVAIFSTAYHAGDEGEEKFYALLTMIIGSMIGLGFAGDLFNLWVWFELMAVSSFFLVAFYHNQAASLEAGIKYLVQSSAGSVLVLIGIALVFGQTGQLSYTEIHAAVGTPSPVLILAGGLFMVGFGVKSALVPLHTWLPDAHSQAPSGISAMLSGVVIEAGLIALLRAVGTINGGLPIWGLLLLIFGTFNMFVGNMMALRQTQVKRLLAYSSVSQVGYMLVGLGVAISYNLVDGAAGAFFHLFNHAIMKGLAFLAAGALLYAFHLSRNKHDPLLVDDLNGTSRRFPVIAFALSVALLALGGLPPLAGFMSKWQIFTAGAQAQNTGVLLLVIFAALNSVLSLGYYAPLVNRMYRYEPSSVVVEAKSAPGIMSIPLFLLTLATVAIGFYPPLVTWLTQPAAISLMASFGIH